MNSVEFIQHSWIRTMVPSVSTPQFVVATPVQELRPYISHYWLSLDNRESTYAALPDGAVDIVVKTTPAVVRCYLYGTTTERTDIALEQNSHYLGIRFRPGQSRHFLNVTANELTDRCESAMGLLEFSLESLLDVDLDARVFAPLNTLLRNHLISSQPVRTRIDDAIALMLESRGLTSVEDAAEAFCRSRRQFERVFQETVGISPKLFSQITRFQYAASRATPASVCLADIAAKAGYADQSHMTHEFKRFANSSPKQFIQKNVAFLQGLPLPSQENRISQSIHEGDSL
jgi:AraC-like DNA-binding protein